jgi:hypothetical protein
LLGLGRRVRQIQDAFLATGREGEEDAQEDEKLAL